MVIQIPSSGQSCVNITEKQAQVHGMCEEKGGRQKTWVTCLSIQEILVNLKSQSETDCRDFEEFPTGLFKVTTRSYFLFLWYYNVSSLEVEVLLLFYWCAERLNFWDGLFLDNLSLNRLPFTLAQHWLKKKECSRPRHIVRSVYLPLSLTSFMVSGNFIFLFFVLSLWHF